MDEYEKIVEMSEFDLREVAMKIGQYLAQYALDNRMNSSQIKSSFGFSIQTFEKAVKKSPDDVRLLLTYGNTLNIYAELVKQIDPDQSRSILKKSERILLSALDLGKTRQQVYYSLGNNYMIMGQYEKAIEILEQGIMVDDKTPTAHWVLALSYLQANKPEKVALAVRSALDRKYLFSRESEAETVAKTLLGQNDLETLFMLYDRIAENSGIGKARAKSASVLYLMGKNQDAIEMAHKALLMDPSLKEEVDSFVEKVRKGEKIEF